MTRRQSEHCASDLQLDRLLAGELSVREAAALRAHFAACGPCRARQAALETEHRALSEQLPALAAIASLAGSASAGGARAVSEPSGPPRGRRGGAHRLGLAIGTLAAALALWVSVGGRPAFDGAARDGQAAPSTRTKGSAGALQLDWVVRRGSEVFTPGVAAPVYPGDALRFGVRTSRGGRATVLSLDAAGGLSVYQDWVPVSAGERQLLPGAVELDEVLGEEHLYGILCERAWPLPTLEGALRSAPERPELPPDCDIDHHVLYKKRP